MKKRAGSLARPLATTSGTPRLPPETCGRRSPRKRGPREAASASGPLTRLPEHRRLAHAAAVQEPGRSPRPDPPRPAPAVLHAPTGAAAAPAAAGRAPRPLRSGVEPRDPAHTRAAHHVRVRHSQSIRRACGADKHPTSPHAVAALPCGTADRASLRSKHGPRSRALPPGRPLPSLYDAQVLEVRFQAAEPPPSPVADDDRPSHRTGGCSPDFPSTAAPYFALRGLGSDRPPEDHGSKSGTRPTRRSSPEPGCTLVRLSQPFRPG